MKESQFPAPPQFNVLAPLVHDWVLTKSDTTLIVQLLLDVSCVCQNCLEVAPSIMLLEPRLTCTGILLLTKKSTCGLLLGTSVEC